MTDIAALIADLIEAGTSAELVGRVAAALAERPASADVRGLSADISADTATERRRAADRERKRTARAASSRPQLSADSPQMSAEFRGMSADSPPEVSPSSSPPHPPNNYPFLPPENPISGAGAGARELGDVVPADWQPSAADRIHAELSGVPADMVDRVAREFSAHSRANGRRYVTPSAGWRLWVSRQHRFGSPAPRARSPTSFREEKCVVAAAQRLRDNGFEIGPRPQSAADRLGLGARADHGRLLSDDRRNAS